MNLSDYIAEKKGSSIIRGVIGALATLGFGAVVLGFFFSIGDSLVPSGSFNTTYQQIKSQGALVLYACIIIPLALLMGAVMAVMG
jgi:hypothetical protein